MNNIDHFVVNSDQMKAIEERIFKAGMPLPALMEKVGQIIYHRIKEIYPQPISVGFLIGCGHNGGDGLVVARELYFARYSVWIYCPFTKLKELTQAHLSYITSLGVPIYTELTKLPPTDLLIDGLFGFGLDRPLEEPIATVINYINQQDIPIISIDLPSGLHTDTAEVLGIAIKANRTLCLGLWKLAFLQDQGLEYIGIPELLPFDIPINDITAILGTQPDIQRITPQIVQSTLPIKRHPLTHKYKQGHGLLIVGSKRFGGAAILAGLGAKNTGVGMLSIAVPESLSSIVLHHLPDALIIPCPETPTGAIASLPDLDLARYQAIAIGPGLTTEPQQLVLSLLDYDHTLILDADALNIIAQQGSAILTKRRTQSTVLTPHGGEFERLFPEIDTRDRIRALKNAIETYGVTILYKGARTAIAHPDSPIWLIPDSTPALARGGSGDVLTGVLLGILAQTKVTDYHIAQIVACGAWWCAEAAILAQSDRTQMGVDPLTLINYLIPAIQKI